MRKSVDLPQPDGPTMQRNSPGAIVRLMSLSASTRPWPLAYSLRTPAIAIAAPRRCAAIDVPLTGFVRIIREGGVLCKNKSAGWGRRDTRLCDHVRTSRAFVHL